MSKNFIKRLGTSILLLTALFIVIYSHQFVLIISLSIIGFIVLVEFNNIFQKLVGPFFLKQDSYNALFKNFNLKFFILNVIAFIYIFFIFCYFSYEVYRLESPTFLLFIISISFSSDVGGYVIGKIIGGKKLTKISPNKTISGSIGSFLFSLIPLIVFNIFNSFDFELNLRNFLLSLLISFISQLGDLFISYLKRKTKLKDTGKILPGHGGMLDRVDGIIFAIPLSYFILKII